jgi:hypothetical protein
MRRTLLTLALVLAGALLAACGKGSLSTSATVRTVTAPGGSSSTSKTPPTAPTTPAAPGSPGAPGGERPAGKRQAQAFAHAVNLTSADVPGFAATAKHDQSSAGEKRLEHQMLSCAGIGGTTKTVLAEGSKEFKLKRQILDLSVSSEVAVQASAADAQKGLAAIRSAHVRGCFSRYLQQVFKGEQTKGATPGPVTIQAGTPPAPGLDGSFGWRVTATFLVRGIKVPIYLDFLGFVDGASQVTLLSSGLLEPFPAAVQQHLFKLLLARAKTHKP